MRAFGNAEVINRIVMTVETPNVDTTVASKDT